MRYEAQRGLLAPRGEKRGELCAERPLASLKRRGSLCRLYASLFSRFEQFYTFIPVSHLRLFPFRTSGLFPGWSECQKRSKDTRMVNDFYTFVKTGHFSLSLLFPFHCWPALRSSSFYQLLTTLCRKAGLGRGLFASLPGCERAAWDT